MKLTNLSSYLTSNNWIESLCVPCTVTSCETWDYPVLQSGKDSVITFHYKKPKKCEIEIRVGIQDGIYCGAYDYWVGWSCTGDGGGGCAPGRKWGEFRTQQDADLYYSFFMLKKLIDKAEGSPRHRQITAEGIQELIKHIDSIIPQQLELFLDYKEAI